MCLGITRTVSIFVCANKTKKSLHLSPVVPLLAWINFNPWICNHTPSKLWNGITYPFLNFNGWAVEVLGMNKWFHPTLYNGCDYSSMSDERYFINVIMVWRTSSENEKLHAQSWLLVRATLVVVGQHVWPICVPNNEAPWWFIYKISCCCITGSFLHRTPSPCIKVYMLYYWRCNFISYQVWYSASPLLKQHSKLETFSPRQDGHHSPDDIFKCIFFNENWFIFFSNATAICSQGQIDNKPALVQIMAWCRLGTKPLSGPMMVKLAYMRHSATTS